MGQRDALYELTDLVELDEGFFSTEKEESEKDEPLKRGRGSQRKTKVVVMDESKPVEGQKTKKGKERKVGHLKMVVIDNLCAQTIDAVVEINIDNQATINSDDSTSYVNLKNLVKEHRPQVIPKEQIGKLLPWVHLAIRNAKRLLLDVHHDIRPGYLQNYLNEFCYKFNRRYFAQNLFDRLLIACMTYKNQFRYKYG